MHVQLRGEAHADVELRAGPGRGQRGLHREHPRHQGGEHRLSAVRGGRQGWQKMIELNLLSAYLVSREVISGWDSDVLARRAIVNIGSTSSLKAFPGLSYYSAAKHGLVGLTKTLAREVAALGIRVNLVCPHLVETQLTEGYRSSPRYDHRIADIPLQRWGEAEEVARAVRFLASDAASYITGAVIPVDGGWSS